MPVRILITRDEKRLASTLTDTIGDSGYCTDTAYDGLGGLDLAKSSIYDVIVLDVILPGPNELDVLSHLGGSCIMTSVFMLTVKPALADRVRGLGAGTDYYLTKPFENQEFLACPWAVLCRQANITPDSFTYGDLLLTLSTPRLPRNGRAVSLNARELELMHLLTQDYSRFLPKEMLLMEVWGYDPSVNANNVEAYISFLHEKLSLLDSSVHITAVRNISYQLEVS